MDVPRFDRIARALGGASTRREVLAALLGLAAARPARSAAGKRRCRRDSPPGQCCRKRDGAITCACDNGGTACGTDCCLVGQQCESGRCLDMPGPPVCIAFGQACKGVGRPCCDGLTCGSGQGGKTDVACYRPAGAACDTTAECTYGSDCRQGICVATPLPCRGTIPVTGDPAVDGEALRALAEDPDGPVTITLCAGVYRARQEIAIVRSLTIEAAADAGGEVVLDGGWSGGEATDGHRVIAVTDADVRLVGVTVRRGYAGESEWGGGVRALSTGAAVALTLTRVRVDTCKAYYGGGVAVDGTLGSATLALHDSEASGNTADDGGGFYAVGATVTLDGATLVSGNTASCDGGGFWIANANMNFRDSARVTANDASIDGDGFYDNGFSVFTCSETSKVCANPNPGSAGCAWVVVDPSCASLCAAHCPS